MDTLTPLSTPNLDSLLSRLRGRLVGHVRRYALGRVLLVSSAGLGLLFMADVALDLPGPIPVTLAFNAKGEELGRIEGKASPSDLAELVGLMTDLP